MTLPWFRLYHRTIDDDKLRLLAFEDRWHFIALCCLKADGLLDEPDSDIRTRRIAVKMGVQVRELDEIGRRLREVDLVDDMLCPLAWDELQFQSDSSTNRTREWRKRQQKQQGNGANRHGDGNVTVQETEADTDTETELEPNGFCASGDAPALTPEHIAEHWNELAPLLGKPLVRKLNPTRRSLLKARIAQNGLSDFVEVFANIRASPFLRGDKGWRGCTFDWVFKQANFQKILEGNYNEQPAR